MSLLLARAMEQLPPGTCAALLDRLDQATLARAFRGALVPQEA